MSGKGKLRRENRCRMCGLKNGVVRLTIHHLIPQSRFRSGRISNEEDASRRTHLIGLTPNLIPLCDRCHRLVESKVGSGGHVHRQRLRASLTAREIAFARRFGGASWFDWFYPLAVESDKNLRDARASRRGMPSAQPETPKSGGAVSREGET